MTYAYLQPVTESEPPANSDVSNTSNWALRNDEFYSRDVSGKEMAICKDNSLLEYPTYGLDMIGKIKDDELHFYLKDHLGSIRATIYDNKLINAQDYDAWGYILEGRTYESEEGKFKFTGKERDEESFYDYFGARYYDARIGRWGQVEPLIDKYVSISGYAFAFLNPIKFNDFTGNGPKVSIGGGEIDFIFDIYYSTKEYDEVLGLDNSDEYNQVAILERLFEKAPEFMNGSFLLMNTLIDVQVSTNLHQKNSPVDDIIDDLEKLAGGYIIAEQAISDQANLLSQERGIGLEGNFLLVAPGKNLRPYNTSGAHELGHDLGLTHKDFTTSTYMNGKKSVKVNSIMGNVTEIKDPKTQKVVKELRTGFSAFEYNKVLRAFKIDNNRNYSTYLK